VRHLKLVQRAFELRGRKASEHKAQSANASKIGGPFRLLVAARAQSPLKGPDRTQVWRPLGVPDCAWVRRPLGDPDSAC
jgi:hypothetical protein